MANTTELMESLAADIGDNVYIDISKWHLYLSDAKIHSLVAEQMYPLLTAGTVKEEDITRVLESIPIQVGGGKKQVPLIDLVPKKCQVDLVDILEKYQNQM